MGGKLATRKLRIEIDVKEMAELLRAVADPTRQQILRLLEARPRSVGEIVEFFSLAQPTISRHLSVLKNVGLVDAERDGKQVIYSLKPANLRSMCHGFFGSFDCCGPLFRKDTEGN